MKRIEMKISLVAIFNFIIALVTEGIENIQVSECFLTRSGFMFAIMFAVMYFIFVKLKVMKYDFLTRSAMTLLFVALLVATSGVSSEPVTASNTSYEWTKVVQGFVMIVEVFYVSKHHAKQLKEAENDANNTNASK